MGYYNDYFYSGQEKTTQKNKYRAKFSERSTFRRRIICVIIKQIPKTEGKMRIKKLKTIATSIVLAVILSATACNGKTECSHNYVIDETASVTATCAKKRPRLAKIRRFWNVNVREAVAKRPKKKKERRNSDTLTATGRKKTVNSFVVAPAQVAPVTKKKTRLR